MRRRLRYPKMTEGASVGEQMQETNVFLRQLVNELNIESDMAAQSDVIEGWTVFRSSELSYSAFKDMTVEIKKASSLVGSMYFSEDIVLSLPFACKTFILTGNAEGGALIVSTKAYNDKTAFKIASSAYFGAGAKFNVRLHVDAMI